jgi:cysteine-rich repeat protein
MRSWIRCALIPITVAVLLGSGGALAAGNACKADLNGDGVVNVGDLAILKSVFFQPCTPVCGDGIVEPPEQCDDGATVNGDGCSSTCKIEPAHQLLATGQTSCWDTQGNVILCPNRNRVCDRFPCALRGQDGDLQTGAALAYVDNGDGTITDVNTGLMWEKLSQDGSVHDIGIPYTWSDAFVKVATLNSSGGFAGHIDWRLPNRRELDSIVNLQNFNPAVSAVFNTGCVASCTVTTCSCTESNFYWSSSSYANSPPGYAWSVSFGDGVADKSYKALVFLFVRAVRGGN